jgi:hypothetical protein
MKPNKRSGNLRRRKRAGAIGIPVVGIRHSGPDIKKEPKAARHFAVEWSMASKLDTQAYINALWRSLDPEDAERLELHRLINGLSRYDYVVEVLKESLSAQTNYDP